MSKKRKNEVYVIDEEEEEPNKKTFTSEASSKVAEQDVSCVVCGNIMHDAAFTTCGCKRSACQSCLKRWFLDFRRCPNCNDDLNDTSIFVCCKQWQNVVDNYPRSCKFGCKHKRSTYVEMQQHETNECVHRLERCPHEACRQIVAHKDIKAHIRLCQLKRCQNFVGIMAENILGCSFTGTPSQVLSHHKTCKFTPDIVIQLKTLKDMTR